MTVSTAVSTAISTVISMAIPMALATACLTEAARADFLYVAPQEPAPIASGTGGDMAQEREPAVAAGGARAHAAIEADAGQPGSVSWQVHAGETLREVLARWGGRADIEALFLTDRRYRLHEGRAFGGSFREATQALFAALSHLPHPPVGELGNEGRTIAVLHRASRDQASPHRAGLHRARSAGAER